MSITDQARETSFSTGTPAPHPSPKHHSSLPRLKEEDFDRAGKLGIDFSVAVEALWANRLRSLLTTLGIFIGVASVVSMVSLIQGISANWMDTLNSLGTNMIIIAPGTSNNLANTGLSSSGGVSVSSRVTSAFPPPRRRFPSDQTMQQRSPSSLMSPR